MARETIASLKAQLQKQREAAATLRRVNQALETDLDHLTRERDEWKRKCELADRLASSYAKECAEWKDAEGKCCDEVDRLTKERDEWKRKAQEYARHYVVEKHTTKASTAEDVTRLTGELDAAKAEIGRLQANACVGKDMVPGYEHAKAVAELRAEIERLRGSTSSAVDEFGAENDRLRQALDAAKVTHAAELMAAKAERDAAYRELGRQVVRQSP